MEEGIESDSIEEYAELFGEDDDQDRMNVKIANIKGFTSVDKIIRDARDGHIVLARIKDLKEENIDELKQCISKLKNAVNNFNGDIIGVGEEFVIVTPNTARIERD